MGGPVMADVAEQPAAAGATAEHETETGIQRAGLVPRPGARADRPLPDSSGTWHGARWRCCSSVVWIRWPCSPRAAPDGRHRHRNMASDSIVVIMIIQPDGRLTIRSSPCPRAAIEAAVRWARPGGIIGGVRRVALTGWSLGTHVRNDLIPARLRLLPLRCRRPAQLDRRQRRAGDAPTAAGGRGRLPRVARPHGHLLPRWRGALGQSGV